MSRPLYIISRQTSSGRLYLSGNRRRKIILGHPFLPGKGDALVLDRKEASAAVTKLAYNDTAFIEGLAGKGILAYRLAMLKERRKYRKERIA